MLFHYARDTFPKHLQKYGSEKRKLTVKNKHTAVSHRRGNPVPLEFSLKAQLEDLRRRFGGYTEDEMRSMIVRLGYRHPETLVTEMDLMKALDELTVEVN